MHFKRDNQIQLNTYTERKLQFIYTLEIELLTNCIIYVMNKLFIKRGNLSILI